MDIPNRLKFARENCGLKLSDVQERTGIDDSCLSSYENGNSEPKFAQLSKLAEIYRLPLSFFFEETVPETQVVLWRNQPENNTEIQAEFLQLCRQYRQLEQWANATSCRTLPDLDDYGERFWYPQVAELARRVRREMELGERPGESLHVTLEEVYGMKVFYLDLANFGIAACASSAVFGDAILLNKNCSRWRRNHDLAHELFHLLTWKRFKHNTGICAPDEQEEKFATCFASNFLLPEEAVKQAIDKISSEDGKASLSQLDCVARQFDVSLESLLWRMHFLYNWKEEQTKGYIGEAKEFVSQTKRKQTPPPQKYPERYKALAIRVFRSGDISLGRFAKLMEISRKEAEQYLDRDVDHEIPITAA